MLVLQVGVEELYDPTENEFSLSDGQTLELEHSLVSLSKWEAKWEIPFLSAEEKSTEQINSYIKMMSLNGEISDESISLLRPQHYKQLNDYLSAKMTATWFSNITKSASREVITAEIIYYWMVSLQIDFQCQYWHLNRLITLIQVCNQKNQPAKKMSQSDTIAKQRALNAQRREKYNSSG